MRQSKVSLNKPSLTLGVGEQFDLNSSLPSGTAAVGIVTAKSAGTTTIKATTYNGKTVTYTVVVKSSIPSKRVYLYDCSIAIPDRFTYSTYGKVTRKLQTLVLILLMILGL